ncbi:hypothetical protein ACPOL_5352 [Acidisarcina polymorpha]|uniref:Uncharacterized protein n=1 Tax=Acidisarcina polymorpha TaxID=2211140 RepID=A0A2Z5G6J9_9BACT|nr:hypothetical protein ACPOL_5352 [Acidisarcina polymorpha]
MVYTGSELLERLIYSPEAAAALSKKPKSTKPGPQLGVEYENLVSL